MAAPNILKSGSLHFESTPELDDLCRLIANLCEISYVALTVLHLGEERIIGCSEGRRPEKMDKELRLSWGLVSRQSLSLGLCEGYLHWSDHKSLPLNLILKQLANIFEKQELVLRLSQEKELLETVTDHLGDVVWMTDPKKDAMIFISRAYESVWERPRAELIKDPFSFVTAIDERDRKRVLEAFPKQAQGLYSEQYRIRTPGGAEKWIRDRAFPVFDDHGQVKLVVGIATDITEQRQSEEIMEQQRNNLILSERFKSLGEMAGGIAHEINNPLSVAQLRVELLQEDIQGGSVNLAKCREGLTVISTMIDRISKIIRSMRSLARDSTNDELVKKDIWDIVTDAIQFLSPKMKQSSVTFSMAEPLRRQIRCRPSELGQVLLNLISNAYDAVEGRPGAWVKVDAVEDDKFVTLRVTDSGQGIPVAIFNKIWDPFFTTKKVDIGNGLGLPISKTLVEKHGGTLTVDLTCENTRFLVKLPHA